MLGLRIPVYPCDAGADTVDENAVFVRKLRRDLSRASHERGVTSIAAAALSVCVEGLVLSILFGVVAFSSFWSILEVFQQRERVRKGWFPENPRRKS